jgi:perosamine synthetase
LTLRALQIEEGDEVILPSFSFMAVTNAILASRATPVFVDVDRNTLNLDPAKIESALSPRAKAIIVVHTFGYPAQVDKIIALADRHGLFVIEDACEAIGAEMDGHKAGTLGDAGIFAFYPNKQITTGEGGAVVTNSAMLAEAVSRFRNQGRSPSNQWFQHTDAGYSYRLSDLNCALGRQQLSRIESIVARREELARSYQRHLKGIQNVKFYGDCPNGRISWFTYPVLLPEDINQLDRDEIWQELNRVGVESGRYFPPAHLQPVMRKYPFRCGDLSETVSVSQRLLCLPFFNSLQEDEIEFVCKSLHSILVSRNCAIHA